MNMSGNGGRNGAGGKHVQQFSVLRSETREF